jgi:hypothetical protein
MKDKQQGLQVEGYVVMFSPSFNSVILPSIAFSRFIYSLE